MIRNKMINVGIAGASGYTGVELAKLITNHPEAKLCAVTSNSYKGKAFTDIFPSMYGFENLICEGLDIPALSQKIDVVFLALPHKVSMAHAPDFLDNNVKVVDLSADYRFTDPGAYEAAYQPHSSSHLLEQSVYGLTEIYKEAVKQTRLVGNPGCYPTSILLPLIPLLKENMIHPEHIICDSKSGVSGAGRSLSLGTHYCEVNDSFSAYKIGGHRHTPEINEQLSLFSQKEISITFTPHLLPLTRGMLSTIYVDAVDGASYPAIKKIYDDYYKDEPFVRVLDQDKFPAISHVKGTNRCDFGFHFNEKTGQVIIVSAIDNLIKGAAGQAVQNMNLMFGLPAETGLDAVQSPL